MKRKYQSSASLAFVRGIHRWPVNSPHKRPVTRKNFHLMTSSCCCVTKCMQKRIFNPQVLTLKYSGRIMSLPWLLVPWLLAQWCCGLWRINMCTHHLNSSSPGQNGRHFADDLFRCTCIFVNEKNFILIKISFKFVHKGLFSNNPALVQIMAWRRTSNEPLSEPMLLDSLTHTYMRHLGEMSFNQAWPLHFEQKF